MVFSLWTIGRSYAVHRQSRGQQCVEQMMETGCVTVSPDAPPAYTHFFQARGEVHQFGVATGQELVSRPPVISLMAASGRQDYHGFGDYLKNVDKSRFGY